MQSPALPPILVVDDNHDNAEIIRQYLEIRGYPITVAHNGDEALALFDTVKPALVLLDVMMPDLGGLRVLQELRADRALAEVPVIALTGRLEAVAELEAELGDQSVFVKPFGVPELLARVAALTRKASS
jgi:DNA-binding response OmpR family regulator